MTETTEGKGNMPARWSVPFFLVLLIILAEMSIRGSASSLSGNIKHIRTIPSVTKQLADLADVDEATLVFIGNSLSGDAVNLDLFDKEVNSDNRPLVHAYKITPDATSIWDWYCIVINNFTHTRSVPDVAIIGFAWEQLSDSETPKPSRLAAHFCDLENLPELIRLGMTASNDIFEYIAASMSELFALREPIHKRVLDVLIPYYRKYAGKVYRPDRNEKTNTRKQEYTYRLLERLLATYKANNIIPVFVAMPVKKPYSLDAALIENLNSHNAIFLDYREMTGISNIMYSDKIHLNAIGSTIFTGKIALDISRLLNQQLF